MASFVIQHFHAFSEGKKAILTRPFTYFKATPCFKIKENLILLWNPNSNLRGTWCTKQGRGQSLFRVFFSNFPQILLFVYIPPHILHISYFYPIHSIHFIHIQLHIYIHFLYLCSICTPPYILVSAIAHCIYYTKGRVIWGPPVNMWKEKD